MTLDYALRLAQRHANVQQRVKYVFNGRHPRDLERAAREETEFYYIWQQNRPVTGYDVYTVVPE